MRLITSHLSPLVLFYSEKLSASPCPICKSDLREKVSQQDTFCISKTSNLCYSEYGLLPLLLCPKRAPGQLGGSDRSPENHQLTGQRRSRTPHCSCPWGAGTPARTISISDRRNTGPATPRSPSPAPAWAAHAPVGARAGAMESPGSPRPAGAAVGLRGAPRYRRHGRAAVFRRRWVRIPPSTNALPPRPHFTRGPAAAVCTVAMGTAGAGPAGCGARLRRGGRAGPRPAPRGGGSRPSAAGGGGVGGTIGQSPLLRTPCSEPAAGDSRARPAVTLVRRGAEPQAGMCGESGGRLCRSGWEGRTSGVFPGSLLSTVSRGEACFAEFRWVTLQSLDQL